MRTEKVHFVGLVRLSAHHRIARAYSQIVHLFHQFEVSAKQAYADRYRNEYGHDEQHELVASFEVVVVEQQRERFGRREAEYGEEFGVIPCQRVRFGYRGQIACVYQRQWQRMKQRVEEQVQRELKLQFETSVAGCFAVVEHVFEELNVHTHGQIAGH